MNEFQEKEIAIIGGGSGAISSEVDGLITDEGKGI